MPNWWIYELLIVTWRQGFKRSTAGSLHHLSAFSSAIQLFGSIVCAHNEHFFEYRHIVRDQISGQLSLTPEKIL